MIPTDATLRRPSFPHSGRLIALPTSRSLAVGQTLDLLDQISIDFPAMPDSIDLNRVAEYQVLSNVILPDGIHQYKGTRPLEIPFSFRLHAFDREYCPKGAYSLLQLAARLHSFILPIDTTGGKVAIRASAISGTPTKTTRKGFVNGVVDAVTGTDGQQEAKAIGPDGGLGFAHVGGEKVFNPVTLRLELIFTDQDSPGIACTGYVREVGVKLNGPFLRGPGKSANLPSSGDFSFIFVHRPGHGNAFNIDSKDFDLQPQAYAHTVKDKLYNTRSLVQIANYQGLNDAQNGGVRDAGVDANGFTGGTDFTAPAVGGGSRIRRP